jgi:hypothetical protein
VSVASANKVGVDDVQSSGSQTGHVLPQDPGGSQCDDDGEERGPQPTGVVGAESEPGGTGGLAWKPSGHNVNCRARADSPPLDGGADVVMPGHVLPVLRQHLPAVVVDLDLADDPHPGPL